MVNSVDRGVLSSQSCELSYVDAGGPNSHTSVIFLLPNPTKDFFFLLGGDSFLCNKFVIFEYN